MADPLFSVRNNFFIGNWNAVVNEASNLQHLSDKDAIERDVFVYRSYIALGSYEVRQATCATGAEGTSVRGGAERNACAPRSRSWC